MKTTPVVLVALALAILAFLILDLLCFTTRAEYEEEQRFKAEEAQVIDEMARRLSRP